MSAVSTSVFLPHLPQLPLESLKQTDNHPIYSFKEKLCQAYTKVIDVVLPINPVNKKREFRLVPFWLEVTIGSIMYSSTVQRYGGHYLKYGYEDSVQRIGKRLLSVCDRPDLPGQFSVVDSNVLNAWCLPGAKIAFYKGLINKMDKEKDTFGVGQFSLEEKIAAVLGHEITHAAARHSAKYMELGLFLLSVSKIVEIAFRVLLINRFEDKNHSNSDSALTGFAVFLFERINSLILQLVSLHSSRQHELEADKYGMVYLYRAGYDPRAAIWLQKFFCKEHPKTNYTLVDKVINVFSSHPSSEERVEENIKTLEAIKQNLLK